jgi:hypothetical protein
VTNTTDQSPVPHEVKGRLLTALELEDAGMDGITVLLEAANRNEATKLQDEIITLARRDTHTSWFIRINADDKASLLRALGTERTGMLLLGGWEFVKKLPPLDVLSRVTAMCLPLLGNEPEARND